MKKILFIASALLILNGSAAFAQQNDKQTPYVEINSAADTSVTPNKFQVSITISEAVSKGKTPIAELEKSLATALRESGVDIKKQLVITGQSSNDGKRKDIYQYKSYLLTLTNPQMVETVFDQLQANGIANASVTESTRSDLKELQAQVRVKAMQNAQQTAAELAAAIGQKIGKAIMIQAYSSAPDQITMRGYTAKLKMGNAMMEDNTLPELQFNDVRVNQNVTVRFILE